jgi:hypothetical protein
VRERKSFGDVLNFSRQKGQISSGYEPTDSDLSRISRFF